MKCPVLSLLFVIALCGSACAGARYNPQRLPDEHTAMVPDPPHPMSKEEVRSLMHQLAAHAAAIDTTLRSAQPERAVVVVQLAQMQSIANTLSQDDAQGVHPMLWQNIEQFRSDLEDARRLAEANPPNYFLAGTVAGACGYCHGPGQHRVN